MDGIHKSGKGIVRVEDLIVCNFVCWPFVWSLWSYQRIPVALLGAHFPVFFLPFLAVLSVFTSPMKLKKPMLFWLAFYLVTLLESHNARWRTYGMDLAISLSAWIICVSVGQRNYDRKKAVNCIRGIGLFVAVSIILERMLRLFSGLLRPLYTTAALDHIKSNGFSGGALTLSGYAGCFIVPGFAALVILQGSGKKNHRFYIEVVIYLVSLILLKKRGFILDIVLGILFLWYLDIRSQGKLAIHKNKGLKRLFAVLGILLALFLLYAFVPFIHTALDGFLAKFYEEDGDFSGRGRLYALAMEIFRNNMLTGIGWGNFREQSIGVFYYKSTKTFEVHNVYLQLLCENGIVGLIAFLLATGSMLLYSSRKCLLLTPNNTTVPTRREIVKLGVFLQVFFLAYCISGNPLYDYNFAVTYFIGVLLAFA